MRMYKFGMFFKSRMHLLVHKAIVMCIFEFLYVSMVT
jgi:hypothetical protein